MVSMKNLHTYGTFVENQKSKKTKHVFLTMFPYRVKYTESDYDIQNHDLLYIIHQNVKNKFEMLENVGNIKSSTLSTFYFAIYIICIIHNL